MTEENATITADPPETVTEVPAMTELAKLMDTSLPKGGEVESAPVVETETTPDKPVADSAEKTEPATTDKTEPPAITRNMREGARLAKISDEDLTKKSPEFLAMLEDAGQTHIRVMGSIGAAKQKAMKGLGQASGDEPGLDEGGEPQDEAVAETAERPAKAVDLAAIKDEFDAVNPDRLVEALQYERTHRTALEASLAKVLEQNEQFLVDQFIGTLDPDAFAHLGKGPTWQLPKDSPERKAREAMHDLASRYALGSELVDGKPVSLIEALALTTNGAEQIRDSALNKKAAAQTATQRRSVHEPGRSVTAKKDPAKEAMAQLQTTMDKAFNRS
jgi:hypothetical protein